MRLFLSAAFAAAVAAAAQTRAHTLVQVDPRAWPHDAAYHTAHGRHSFVVDDSVAARLAHAVVVSRPWTAADKVSGGGSGAAAFPWTRGAVVRIDHAGRATAAELAAVLAALGAGAAEAEPAAPTTHAAHVVGNARVAVVTPVDAAAAARVAALEFVVEVLPRRTYARQTVASHAAEFGSAAAAVASAWPGRGVGSVAVGDSGLDVSHCAFYDPFHSVPYAVLPVDTVVAAAPTAHSKLRAYFTVCLDAGCSQRTDAADTPGGHGTFVCDQVAGSACAGGVPGPGVTPAAPLVFFDFGVASAPEAIELPSNFEPVLLSALASGALSFSASWGSAGYGYGDLARQIDETVRANRALVFGVAGGNSGNAQGSDAFVGDPAGCKNCLVFGAGMLGAAAYEGGQRGFHGADVDAHPENYAATAVASFTSLGPTADGRVAPTLVAPGVRVVAASAGGAPGHMDVTTKTGTSMAAPNWPSGNVRQCVANATGAAPATVSSATVRAAAVLNTVPATSVVDALPGAQAATATGQSAASRSGFGVAAFAPSFWAAGAAGPGAPSNWAFIEDALSSFESDTFCFELAAAGTAAVSAALVWNDPAGAALVNVLDLLVLVAPASGAGEAAAAAYDTGLINNHKRVSLPAVVAAAGAALRVTVYAPGLVTSGPQEYSIAVRCDGPAVARVECAPEACDPMEPPVQCAVVHGSGVYSCVPETRTLTAACFPTRCDSGFVFSGLQCVAADSPDAGPPPATDACDLEGAGEAWVGTACACVAPRTCANLALCGEACAAQAAASDVTTAAPTFADPPQDSGGPGASYWLGIAFWLFGLAVFVLVVVVRRRPWARTAEALAALCAWNLLAGAAVAFDCGAADASGVVPLCLSDAHLWGLWTLAAVSMAETLVFMDSAWFSGTAGWSWWGPAPPSAPAARVFGGGGAGAGAAAGTPASAFRPAIPTDANAAVLWTLVVLAAAFGLMDLAPASAFFTAVVATAVLCVVLFDSFMGLTAMWLLALALALAVVLVVAGAANTSAADSPLVFTALVLLSVWLVALFVFCAWGNAPPAGRRAAAWCGGGGGGSKTQQGAAHVD